MKKACLFLLIGLFLGVSISYSQNPLPSPTPKVEDPRNMIRERNQTAYRMRTLREIDNSGDLAEADLIKNNQKYVNLTKKDKELISIHPEDEDRFEEFLKLSKTGFIRLYDSTLCNESRNIIYADRPCPAGITGKATAFSFRKQIYTVSVFSDLQNASGLFQIAGINQLGFFSNLGNVTYWKA